jgi:hypothetical protein
MNKDAIINQLERIYANLVALGTYYFHEHCEYNSGYSVADNIDTIEFGLWDAELRIKEIIKLLEESHGASTTSTTSETSGASSGFRDTRDFNDTESWETSKWTYDAGMAMAFQDCGTEEDSSQVSQEDGEAAAQEAIRRY